MCIMLFKQAIKRILCINACPSDLLSFGRLTHRSHGSVVFQAGIIRYLPVKSRVHKTKYFTILYK